MAARKPKPTPTPVAEAAHAVLSASGSELWLTCAGSAWLQSKFPDDPSEPAAEGTFAHALAAARLKHYLAGETGVSAEETELLATPEAAKYYNADMDEHVNGYVRRCIIDIGQARAVDPQAVILVEQRLDYSRWVPQGFGTGDLVIVAHDTAGKGYVLVRDLKYGKGVYVEVEDNSQLKLYALGAYAALSSLYEFDTVRCIIDQPRRGGVREMSLPTTDLVAWADATAKPAGHKAWRIFTGEEPPSYTPGSHCSDKFCRARHECRARADMAMETLAKKPKGNGSLSDEEVASLLPALKEAVKWANGLLDWAERTAVAGERKWPGFKLVTGRSNRYIADEQAVVSALRVEGFPEAVLYDRNLKSLTELEKLVGEKTFAKLVPEGAVKKPDGKPTLVPESDPRPQWKPQADAEDVFDEEVV